MTSMTSTAQARGARRRTRVAALVAALATGASLTALPAAHQALAADAPGVDTAHAEANLAAHSTEPKKNQGVDRFIVAVKDEAAPRAETDPEGTLEDVLEAAEENNNVTAEDVSSTATGDIVVSTDKKLSEKEAREFMEDLAQGDNVEYIEPDVTLTIAETNDTYWDKLWGFHAEDGARVDRAWDYGVSGDGQVVAIVDSGILPHPDLDAHVLPGYDFISDPRVSRDGSGRDSDPTDEGDWFRRGECGKDQNADSSWHGTHVAGTIAAIGDNNEGVVGVAPDAQIIPVRALGKCGGSLSDIADAVVWAAGGHVPGVPDNPHPADVINMSLGGRGQCSRTYQKAIDKAVAYGATVVAAAGNDNRNAGAYQPASCNNVITVAATGETGSKAYYSNYGDVVDLAAPGGDRSVGDTILSTLNTGRTTPGTASYGTMQGTSMATPLVAGVAALLHEADPALRHDDIERILTETARELPGHCNGGCGAGLINAERAVQVALGEDATVNPKPTTSEATPTAEPTPAKPTAKPTAEPTPDRPTAQPTPTAEPTTTPAQPEPTKPETTTPAPTTRPVTTPPTTTSAYRPPYYYNPSNPYYPYYPRRNYNRRYWDPYWYLYRYGGNRYVYTPVRYVYSWFR
ncbi:S8 family peptidase [Corynebacterium sp. 13CS0277]|uniref:S8 family peptidase n=1 Tax=Corynebacterium sp. 13CS0277 TaxID=2071994 RepID=UPI0013047D5A|nr:S8 family peptidase [Corynebacterium sp. 13CS0277]